MSSVPEIGSGLEILMRHRAVLFGLLGAFLIFAAFKRAYQTVAYLGGFFSAAARSSARSSSQV